jgi:ABC-type branched-subunit amino acid transport system substrate-binding protein
MATTKNFQGLTGVITLNAAGDQTTPTLQFQQVQAGSPPTWVFKSQFAVGGTS